MRHRTLTDARTGSPTAVSIFVIRQYASIVNSENIMSLSKQGAIIPCLITLLILAVMPLLLKGVLKQQKYRLAFKNCDLTDKYKPKSAASLVACSALCASSTFCDSFVWRQTDCGHLDNCPKFCNASVKVDTEWNVYCHEGKIYC